VIVFASKALPLASSIIEEPKEMASMLSLFSNSDELVITKPVFTCKIINATSVIAPKDKNDCPLFMVFALK